MKSYKKAFGLEFESLDDLDNFLRTRNTEINGINAISYYAFFHQMDEESKAKVRKLMNGDNSKFGDAVYAVINGKETIND